ncbi:RNA-binding S4 domain-containing protein [Atopococcus tabaci]|uniref:RNA-binding S4 domain-containing protein n=1 Tax=Atopococcus tabaci TaxID=269774 RepID=UPI00040A96A2|nr:RNA-binding S4 domain-containing protein [Atopococcus tabaci]
MRIDKFLKVSRIIKRRSVAKEIADKGRVMVNGKVAKSSTSVQEGDELEIQFGNKTLAIRVEKLLDTTKKDEAKELYTVISETYTEENRK